MMESSSIGYASLEEGNSLNTMEDEHFEQQ